MKRGRLGTQRNNATVQVATSPCTQKAMPRIVRLNAQAKTRGIRAISELIPYDGNVVAVHVVRVYDSCSLIPTYARRIFSHIHHNPGNIVGNSADEDQAVDILTYSFAAGRGCFVRT